METITAPAPALAQWIYIVVLFAVYLVGVWVRPALDHTTTPITPRQTVATAIAGFMLFCLPLSVPIYDAFDTRNDLLGISVALVPIFLAGLTARREIESRFRAGPSQPSANQPGLT